jgi:hypothetical protein
MMGSFALDISRFVQKTGLKPDVVLRKLAFTAYRNLILKSPVDTGRFRASWRIGVDVVDLSTYPEVTHKGIAQGGYADPPPDDSGVQAVIGTAKFGQVIFITNNLPYAQPLEDGSSKQAPQGVLAITMAELRSGFQATVNSVK